MTIAKADDVKGVLRTLLAKSGDSSVKELAFMLGMSYGTIDRLLSKMGYRKMIVSPDERRSVVKMRKATA